MEGVYWYSRAYDSDQERSSRWLKLDRQSKILRVHYHQLLSLYTYIKFELETYPTAFLFLIESG
jgi:hypothetical protein